MDRDKIENLVKFYKLGRVEFYDQLEAIFMGSIISEVGDDPDMIQEGRLALLRALNNYVEGRANFVWFFLHVVLPNEIWKVRRNQRQSLNIEEHNEDTEVEHIDSDTMEHLDRPYVDLSPLECSELELFIMEKVAEGWKYKEIAKACHVSTSSISNFIRNIRKRIRAKNLDITDVIGRI